jgi:hypothetical protein
MAIPYSHLFDESHCDFSKDLGLGLGIVRNYAKICCIRTHPEESKDVISWVRRFQNPVERCTSLSATKLMLSCYSDFWYYDVRPQPLRSTYSRRCVGFQEMSQTNLVGSYQGPCLGGLNAFDEECPKQDRSSSDESFSFHSETRHFPRLVTLVESTHDANRGV